MYVLSYTTSSLTYRNFVVPGFRAIKVSPNGENETISTIPHKNIETNDKF